MIEHLIGTVRNPDQIHLNPARSLAIGRAKKTAAPMAPAGGQNRKQADDS